MKKIKESFSDIFDFIEGILIIILLIFGYPFYKKSLKEIWKSIVEHKDDNDY